MLPKTGCDADEPARSVLDWHACRTEADRTARMRLTDKVVFVLMHDQDWAGRMSRNLLGVAARHQPLEPGIVVRRYHSQVRLE